MNATLGKLHADVLRASRRRKRRDSSLVEALLAVSERAGAAATAMLLAFATESRDVIALRTLGFHLARLEQTDALDDCALAWLLDNMPSDLSSRQNGLTAIQAVLADRGELPFIARPWVGGHILNCLSAPEVVLALSSFELARHVVASGALPTILPDGDAPRMLEAVQGLRIHALDDEVEDFDRVEGALQGDLSRTVALPDARRDLGDARKLLGILDLPAELSELSKSALRWVEAHLHRLEAAREAGRPGVELHVEIDGVGGGIGQALDEQLRCLLRRIHSVVRSSDDDGLLFYNPVPASYTLGARGQDDEETRALGRYLLSLLPSVGHLLQSEGATETDLDRLDTEARIVLAELTDRLIAEGKQLRAVLVDPMSADWKRTVQFDSRAFRAGRRDERRRRLVGEQERRSALRLGSGDVPQADLLERVIRAVELLCDRAPLEPDTLGVGLRQVKYYAHAAYVLGLIDRDRAPTDRGRALVRLRHDPVAQRRALAGWFEDSLVGRSWRRWAGVDVLTELDPTSATAFLSEQSVGLAPDTRRRRARTLTAWLSELRPYHYANGDNHPSVRSNPTRPA